MKIHELIREAGIPKNVPPKSDYITPMSNRDKNNAELDADIAASAAADQQVPSHFNNGDDTSDEYVATPGKVVRFRMDNGMITAYWTDTEYNDFDPAKSKSFVSLDSPELFQYLRLLAKKLPHILVSFTASMRKHMPAGVDVLKKWIAKFNKEDFHDYVIDFEDTDRYPPPSPNVSDKVIIPKQIPKQEIARLRSELTIALRKLPAYVSADSAVASIAFAAGIKQIETTGDLEDAIAAANAVLAPIKAQ